jgi:hypothetical protein
MFLDMAYDIHLIKADNWSETQRQPVTPYDLDVLFERDGALTCSTHDTYEMRDDFDRLTRCYVIAWRDEPCFHYFNGEIVCCNAEQHHISKLVDMAQQIGAKVVGDDGERYAPRRLLFWRTGIRVEQPE